MTNGTGSSSQVTEWHCAGELAVYLRVSTEGQKNRKTEEYQRAQVKQLSALGFQRLRVIDEDLGKSGATTHNRTGWQALEADIEAECVRGLAVTEVSRLGRDDLTLFKFLRLCKRKNVLLFENGILRDLREISDSMLLKLQAVISEGERERIALRCKRGRRVKAEKGIPVSQLPAGFDRGPNREAVRSADPHVREIVERIFREALEGWGPGQIARRLRAEGLKSPARSRLGGIEWRDATQGAIHRMLTNPLYAGYLVVFKYKTVQHENGVRCVPTGPTEHQWVRGQNEQYISLEQFERIRKLMAARAPRSGPPVGEGAALCGKLVHCGRCGQRLRVAYISLRHPSAGDRGYHYYACPGPWRERQIGPKCMNVSGRVLDRMVEEIVLGAVHCPPPTELRQAIAAENDRRLATTRLLAAEVRRAEANMIHLRSRLEANREQGRNPRVTEMYEDQLEAALNAESLARRRAAAVPPPVSIDDTPATLAEMGRVFQEFPRVWPRLSVRDRKAIVRLIVDRIDIPEKGETVRVRVTLHGGEVVERVHYADQGRRRLVETLRAEGHSLAEIATEMGRRGICGQYGRPYKVQDVKGVLEHRNHRPTKDAIFARVRALWAEQLPIEEIAARLNAEGFRTGSGTPWRASAVHRVAMYLGLTPRWHVHRERLRAPLAQLCEAGYRDAEIAAEFIRLGLPTLIPGGTWHAAKITAVRQSLGIRVGHRRQRQPTKNSSSSGTSVDERD